MEIKINLSTALGIEKNMTLKDIASTFKNAQDPSTGVVHKVKETIKSKLGIESRAIQTEVNDAIQKELGVLNDEINKILVLEDVVKEAIAAFNAAKQVVDAIKASLGITDPSSEAIVLAAAAKNAAVDALIQKLNSLYIDVQVTGTLTNIALK